MQAEQSRNEGFDRRFYFLGVIFLLTAMFLAGYLLFSQFGSAAPEVPGAATAGNLELPRGSIVDRNGSPLAFDTFEYDVEASPAALSLERRDMLAAALAPVLQMQVADVRAKLQTDAPFVSLATRQPASVAAAVRALWDEEKWPVKVVPHPTRYYPEKGLAAHILGFVNKDPAGWYGVEAYYEPELHGGTIAVEDLDSPAQEGVNTSTTTLVLTIDRFAQRIVEEELSNAISRTGAIAGQIVVVVPQTGEVLASASWPTYLPAEYWRFTNEEWDNPLISQVYEPGSVFKLVTYAAALDTQTIGPNESFYDPGSIEIGGREILNWDRVGHGYVTVEEALGNSLNVVAADIARRMGRDTFYKYIRRFGFGEYTEVDLKGEVPGLVKTPFGDDPSSALWSDSDLGTNSFGQGISVTPLQMVNAVSSIANSGLLMAPHIVRQRIVGGQVFDVQPRVIRRTIGSDTAQTLTSILVDVVDEYLPEAQIPGYSIAGKTGTAQIPVGGTYLPSDYIASYVGWGPATNPQLVILVKLDRPKTDASGREAAVPAFHNVAERLFQYLEIPPDR